MDAAFSDRRRRTRSPTLMRHGRYGPSSSRTRARRRREGRGGRARYGRRRSTGEMPIDLWRDADDEDGGDDARDARATGRRSRYDAREGATLAAFRARTAGEEEDGSRTRRRRTKRSRGARARGGGPGPSPRRRGEAQQREGRSASTRVAREVRRAAYHAPLRDKNAAEAA